MSYNYDDSCNYRFTKKGWRCTRVHGHLGPCALVPYWWNWREDARRFRRNMRGIM